MASFKDQAPFFLWSFAVILWSTFAVVRHADGLAELLGEHVTIESEGRAVYVPAFSHIFTGGGQHARGSHLLLLNQDFIPRQTDLVEVLMKQYRSHNQVGAVGPLMINPDEFIQHAGMYSRQVPGMPDCWQTEPERLAGESL